VVVGTTSIAVAVALALTMALGSDGGSDSSVATPVERSAERSRPEAATKPGDDLLVEVVTGLLDEVLDGEHFGEDHDDEGGEQSFPGRDSGSGGSDTGTRGS
jgi:hypothetical protein